MKTLNFAKNWNNKLDNKVFTTIRKSFNPLQPGSTIAVQINYKTYCFAKVNECLLCKFADIPTLAICLDTGLMPIEAYKQFEAFGLDINNKDQDCMLLILERTEKPLSEQLRAVFTGKS